MTSTAAIVLTREQITSRHPEPVSIVDNRSGDPTDSELRDWLGRFLAGRPRVNRRSSDGVWIFPYGSLLWKPEIPVIRRETATVWGWHRRFCLWQTRSRGTPSNRCLMMALDRGGACASVIERVESSDLEEAIWPLWRREMRGRGYLPRWVRAKASDGQHPALTFVVNHASHRYTGRLDLATAARHLADACGPRGACAEYLLNTVEALRELGVYDRNLWRLQAAVSARLSEA